MFEHGAMPKFDQTFAQENNFAEIWSGTKI